MKRTATVRTRRRRVALGLALILLWPATVLYRRFIMGATLAPGRAADAAAPLAAWPWPGSQSEALGHGISHYLAHQGDGTSLDLMHFDFAANPRLRLELYDQDADDAKPFDDSVNYWPRGVDSAVVHLNKTGQGTVLAAWNGPFFGYRDKGLFTRGTAHHVGPVVLGGKLHDYGRNHRWTFGASYRGGRPHFAALHLPAPATLSARFEFAAGGLQCLIRDGKPLKLQPFPVVNAPPLPQPVPSTPAEVGHVPLFDHMRTSRTSLGWSRDGRQLYLLVVREPDAEFISGRALRHGVALLGGWTVADMQRFWRSLGIWGAVNSDGGDVAQLLYRNPDASFTLVPSRKADPAMRRQLPAGYKPTYGGGCLMYFTVREVPPA